MHEENERLARIETKLDAMAARLDAQHASQAVARKDHEDRIRKLEGWRAYTVGLAAAASYIVSNLKTLLPSNH